MDLTSKFSLDSLAGIQNQLLSEISNTTLLEKTVLQKDVSHSANGFSFSAAGDAGVAIQLFNDADDDNGNTVAEELQIEKAITTKGLAFLNYHLTGKLKGGVSAELADAELGLDVVSEVSHQIFVTHAPTEKLFNSIADDIKDFKLVFDASTLTKLKDWDAVVQQGQGTLDFDATLSVSDSLAPVLSNISKLINASESISLNVEASASLNIAFSIADTFQTIIQRRGSDFYVSIRKDFTSKRAIEGSLGASAKIKNPEIVLEALNAIMDKGEKGITENIEKLRTIAISKLTETQKELLKKGANLIGLDIDNPFNTLYKKYFEKKDEINQKATDYIEATLKIGATYAYEKTVEKKSVLTAMFSPAALKSQHENIIRLRVNEIVKQQKKTAGIKILSYLDLARISITRVMKIGLTFGDFELSQAVRKEDIITREKVVDGDEVIQSAAFSSSKFTTEKLGIFKERINSLSLGGTYRGAPKTPVTMADLDYEFSLQWSENFKKYKQEKIRSAIDFAVTWGILNEDDFDATLKTLRKLLKDKRRFTFSASIKMKTGLFDSIVDNIANITSHQLAMTLAAAVQYADYNGRRTPKQRTDLYYSFFVRYSEEKSPSTIDYDALARILATFLRTNNKVELANFEEGTMNDFNYVTTRWMIEHNYILEQFKAFRAAVNLLNNNVKSFTSFVKSDRLLDNIKAIRLQREFNMRFLGRLIHDMAIADNIGEKVERLMSVDYDDDKGAAQKYIIAK
jgi:hypothetical protein